MEHNRLKPNLYVTTGILVLIRLHKKADLQEMKVNNMNDTPCRKVCADENKVDLGKNRHHRPSGLDDWLIVVVRQADKILVV